MFNLIKTYVSQSKSYKYINLTYGHIILLSYLMGYIKDVSASESFWGSNNTLASDIGVSSRTIQRWLKDLEDTGFIAQCLYMFCLLRHHLCIFRLKEWTVL